MGRPLRSNFVTTLLSKTSGKAKPRKSLVAPNSPRFGAKLKVAISEATSAAVERRHAAGRPVYIADDNGDVCELLPNGKTRKLSQSELDALS